MMYDGVKNSDCRESRYDGGRRRDEGNSAVATHLLCLNGRSAWQQISSEVPIFSGLAQFSRTTAAHVMRNCESWVLVSFSTCNNPSSPFNSTSTSSASTSFDDTNHGNSVQNLILTHHCANYCIDPPCQDTSGKGLPQSRGNSKSSTRGSHQLFPPGFSPVLKIHPITEYILSFALASIRSPDIHASLHPQYLHRQDEAHTGAAHAHTIHTQYAW